MAFRDGELIVQELGSKSYKHRDDEDLARHGKKQRFQVWMVSLIFLLWKWAKQRKRNFGFLSMLGFTTTMMCTWEAVLL
jgi:choline transport protein